jgi:hypothetical protein
MGDIAFIENDTAQTIRAEMTCKVRSLSIVIPGVLS